MTSNKSKLDQIAKKVDSKYKASGKEVHFRLNSDGEDGSWSLFKSCEHYVLDKQGEVLISLVVMVFDFKNKDEAEFKLELRLRLNSAKPNFIRESVKDQLSLQRWLEQWLHKRMEALAQSRSNKKIALNQWLFAEQDKIVAKLEFGLEEQGLANDIRVTKDSLGFGSVSYSTSTFNVRPNDVSLPVAMSVDFRLDPKQGTATLGPITADEWHVWVQDWIQNYVELHVGINSLLDRTSQSFTELETKLQEAIWEFNWQVQRLTFNMKDLPFETVWKTESMTVDWRGLKGSLKFKVKTHVEVVNYKLYLESGQISLAGFSQDAFQRAFDSDLFKGDFEQLNPTSIDEIYGRVGNKVKQEALKLGMKVRYLVADPIVHQWKWLSLEHLSVPISRYATANASKEIEFSINVLGKFTNLHAVMKAESTFSDVPKAVIAVATEAAQAMVRKYPYYEFFAQYLPEDHLVKSDVQDPSLVSEALSVCSKKVLGYLDQEIARNIKQELFRKLSFDVCTEQDVIITRNDSDLLEIFKAIENTPPQTLEFILEPEGAKNKLYHVPCTLQFRYLTPAADRMALINTDRNVSFSQITSEIKSLFFNQLNRRALNDLRGTNPSEVIRIRAELNTNMNVVLMSLGLSIEIESIVVRASVGEKSAQREIDDRLELVEDFYSSRSEDRKENRKHQQIARELRATHIMQLGEKILKRINAHDSSPNEVNELMYMYRQFCKVEDLSEAKIQDIARKIESGDFSNIKIECDEGESTQDTPTQDKPKDSHSYQEEY